MAAGLFAVAPRLRERPLAPFLGAFFHPTVPAVLVLALLHTLAAATTVGFLTYSAR